MLRLTGRKADGWDVSLSYVPPDQARESMVRIDEAAAAAGREPSAIRRLYNVSGVVSEGQGGEGDGVPAGAALALGGDARGVGDRDHFDTFVFWPRHRAGSSSASRRTWRRRCGTR